ncbi:hypothetical protein H310_05127 [Aphanomyces invadans]|uniref:RING-type domain-containing protein n=1 Tax=Aphanomyces invadans TaxID=157072 RepID=A0A024UDP6_9STRA|nr:hypothetical protein H310_05127 [Aphanomyces invadans]ETW03758.1 hypothetical protein H310_05127 [Aphanomyces invadans]|eukprot:XP_008867987.1 hypothetical protein H310_05127 [Aphanomyces invadans]
MQSRSSDDPADHQDNFVGTSDSDESSSNDEPVVLGGDAVLGSRGADRSSEEQDDDVQITDVRWSMLRQTPGQRFILPTLRPPHRRANPRPPPSSGVSYAIVLVDEDDPPDNAPPPPLKRRKADGRGVPPTSPPPSLDVGRSRQDSINAAKVHMRCPLCLDTMVTITSTKCGHVYCRSCIAEAINHIHKCPLCSRELSLRDIHPVFL